MGQCKLPILLASSRINVQELTALPWKLLKASVLALYNGQQVFAISPKPIRNPLLKKPAEFKNLRAALDSLIGDSSMGVEEKDLDIGRVLELAWTRSRTPRTYSGPGGSRPLTVTYPTT